jgi:hypothetical protein
MGRFRLKKWWQAGLAWGTAMFLWYVVKDAIDGRLTAAIALKDLLVWEVAGVVFGLLLTGALSLFAHQNLFRTGFPDKRGDR